MGRGGDWSQVQWYELCLQWLSCWGLRGWRKGSKRQWAGRSSSWMWGANAVISVEGTGKGPQQNLVGLPYWWWRMRRWCCPTWSVTEEAVCPVYEERRDIEFPHQLVVLDNVLNAEMKGNLMKLLGDSRCYRREWRRHDAASSVPLFALYVLIMVQVWLDR